MNIETKAQLAILLGPLLAALVRDLTGWQAARKDDPAAPFRLDLFGTSVVIGLAVGFMAWLGVAQ